MSELSRVPAIAEQNKELFLIYKPVIFFGMQLLKVTFSFFLVFPVLCKIDVSSWLVNLGLVFV